MSTYVYFLMDEVKIVFFWNTFRIVDSLKFLCFQRSIYNSNLRNVYHKDTLNFFTNLLKIQIKTRDGLFINYKLSRNVQIIYVYLISHSYGVHVVVKILSCFVWPMEWIWNSDNVSYLIFCHYLFYIFPFTFSVSKHPHMLRIDRFQFPKAPSSFPSDL